MNIRGLKQASRQSLQDSGVNFRLLTLLFLLCFYAIAIPCDIVTFFLDRRIQQTTGLGAAALGQQYDLWVITTTLVLSLFSSIWSAGYSAFALNISRGRPVAFRTFTTGFRMFGKVAVLMLLQFLYIFLWSMLFLIPGIVAALRYSMALFILLDDPSLSASEAINASKQLTYGHKWELFTLHISFFWYFIPSLIGNAMVSAYGHALVPALATQSGLLFVYLFNLLAPLAMDVLAQAYRLTTTAHAYNWLLSLDRARRASLHDFHPSPNY